MFYYVPDVNRAYADMIDLMYVVPFGAFAENIASLGGTCYGNNSLFSHVEGVSYRFL